MLIQIIVSLVSIIIISLNIWRFLQAKLSIKSLFFWTFFWLVAIILVWNPFLTNIFASWLGVTRGADAVFYLSLIFIFYFLFYLLGRIENLERQLSDLVRKIALKETEKFLEQKFSKKE